MTEGDSRAVIKIRDVQKDSIYRAQLFRWGRILMETTKLDGRFESK